MKVTITDSSDHTLTLEIKGDDHTISNLVKSEVLKSDAVSFAGYNKKHTLSDEATMIVKTEKGKTPLSALKQAVDNILKELDAVKSIK